MAEHADFIPEEIRRIPAGIAPTLWRIESDDPHGGDATAGVYGTLEDLSADEQGPLVRLHSACFYSEALGSIDCDCEPQLRRAQALMAQAGGILFYLQQEGRGAGNYIKAKGYALRDAEGLDTAQAYERLGIPFDQRRYGHCAAFLLEHSIQRVRLLSNNPRKIAAMEAAGIVVTREPLVVGVNDNNRSYLRLKRDHAGHLLPENL